MLHSRLTTRLLLIINLAIILFIALRAGSVEVAPTDSTVSPLTIRVLHTPPPAYPDTLLLNDFEGENDRTNMYDQGGEFSLSLTGEHVTHGRSALLITRDPDVNMELATVHYPKEWQAYERLEVDIFNDGDSAASIWLRVGSQYDARRFYVRSQKFGRDYLLRPGMNTIRVPIKDIIAAFGGRMPKRKSLHLNIPPGGGRGIYVDYLRLVKDDGTNQ
jgi:hypothetical protein